MMSYYTLVVRTGPGEPFAPQFGDYDRAVVLAERDAYMEPAPYPPTRRSDMRIIRTATDQQRDIDAAVAALNLRLRQPD